MAVARPHRRHRCCVPARPCDVLPSRLRRRRIAVAPTQRRGVLTSRRRCGLLAAALLFAVRLTCPRPQPQQRCRPPHPGLWRPHLETHEAGWACCAVFLESCQSRKARNKKTLVIFLPYDAAPHFETLSHRNSQQNKERRPLNALKHA